MRKLATIALMVVAVVAITAGLFSLAGADNRDNTREFKIAPMRSVTSSVAMQQVYDTLNVASNRRINLMKFTVTVDDSAQVPNTLRIRFMSLNSRTQYLQLAETYTTANMHKTTVWEPQFTFPYDTSIVIHYYIVGGGPNTLDSLSTAATYWIEGK